MEFKKYSNFGFEFHANPHPVLVNNKQHFFIVSHLTPHARHLNEEEEAPDWYARSRIRHLYTGQRARVSFSPRSKGVPRFSIGRVIASLT